MEGPETVAFKAGVYVHENRAGVCEVHVPRDVMVGECRQLLLAGGKEGGCRGKENARLTLEK